jgi:hypothetical protein
LAAAAVLVGLIGFTAVVAIHAMLVVAALVVVVVESGE